MDLLGQILGESSSVVALRQQIRRLLDRQADSTIFFDEIGLLPEALQAKLLKVIEERTVRRLGGTRGRRAGGLPRSPCRPQLPSAA